MSCRGLYFISFLCVNYSLFCEDIREVKLSDVVIKGTFHTYKCSYKGDEVMKGTANEIIEKLKKGGYYFYDGVDRYTFPWNYTCRFKDKSNEIKVIELDVRVILSVRDGMDIDEYISGDLVYCKDVFRESDYNKHFRAGKRSLKDIISWAETEFGLKKLVKNDNFVVTVTYMTEDNIDLFKQTSLEKAMVSDVICVRKCVIKYDYKVPPTPSVVTPPVPPVGDPVDKGSNSSNNSNSSSGSSSPKEKKCCCK